MTLDKLFSLKGKKAVVTGGARGIGSGITKALAMAGAEVLVIGSSPETTERIKKIIEPGMMITGMQGDLSQLKLIPDLYTKALKYLGDIDILVNNAAIQFRNPAEKFPLEEFQRIIDVNLTAAFLLSQSAAQTMMKKKYGKIINLASMNSFFGSVNVAAYSASKGGIAQLTKAMSNEWSSFGINVNAIAPGGFRTEMTKTLWTDDSINDVVMKGTPAGRWGEQDDIMGAAIFLASHASDYICGAILPVDGGYLVR